MDPRVKLVIIGLAMIAFFIVQKLYLLFFTGCLILLIAKIAWLPMNYIMKGLKFIGVLALFTFVFNLFLTPGEAIFSFYKLQATYQGLDRGTCMALRLILLVLATSVLSLTTSPILLTDAVEKMLSPFRSLGIPSHELAMVSTIALRFVPTLTMETERIIKAQSARGASLDRGNIIERSKALAPIMVPLFVSAFRHAEDLAMAMEARCYKGGENRTRLRELKFTFKDSLSLCTGILYLALLILCDWWLNNGFAHL